MFNNAQDPKEKNDLLLRESREAERQKRYKDLEAEFNKKSLELEVERSTLQQYERKDVMLDSEEIGKLRNLGYLQ